VQRLGPPSNAWRQYPPARAYGDAYERDPLSALRSARNVGRLMAEDLIAAGITANCVPVLDVPQPGAHEIIGSRAYSDRIERIMALARAHAAGFADGGVMPVVKHMPGHGRARADSHLELPVVEASRAELEAVDFPPFAAVADAPMAMTAHVVFTALDKTAPATLSKKVISTVIRKEIGFRGLLMTDDLSMKALSGSYAGGGGSRRSPPRQGSEPRTGGTQDRPQAAALRPQAGPQGSRKSASRVNLGISCGMKANHPPSLGIRGMTQ
jgi:beta-N-acetylhexosaminidase